jgi:hypothetical protein
VIPGEWFRWERAGEHKLPDTGSLRGDIVALFAPDTSDGQQLRLQALTGLLQLSATEPRLADAATRAGIGPWIEANQILIHRAIDRGEFPPADVDTLAQVIPLLCLSRAVQRQPITHEFSLTMLDSVILPALRGGFRPDDCGPDFGSRGHLHGHRAR